MPSLFRQKKRIPEVNYFQGGSSWTDNAITVSIEELLGGKLSLIAITNTQLMSYGYNNAVAKGSPYSFDFAGGGGATIFAGTTTGVTGATTGIITPLVIEFPAPGTSTITFKNCFVNKVFTIIATA